MDCWPYGSRRRVFKVVAGDHFSFMVFGGSQILIDLEPAVRLMTGSAILHGFTHTLLGALLIGTLAGGIGKPVTERVLRGTDIPCHNFTWRVSLTSAAHCLAPSPAYNN